MTRHDEYKEGAWAIWPKDEVRLQGGGCYDTPEEAIASYSFPTGLRHLYRLVRLHRVTMLDVLAEAWSYAARSRSSDIEAAMAKLGVALTERWVAAEEREIEPTHDTKSRVRAMRDLILEASEEELREALGDQFEVLAAKGRRAVSEAAAKVRREDMGCRCRSCGRIYRVDVLVPNILWDTITVDDGASMLCGRCITGRIEKLGEFGAYRLMPVDEVPIEPAAKVEAPRIFTKEMFRPVGEAGDGCVIVCPADPLLSRLLAAWSTLLPEQRKTLCIMADGWNTLRQEQP